jgi:plastocyanin
MLSAQSRVGSSHCSIPLARRHLLFAMLSIPSILLGCGRRTKTEQQVVDLFVESDGDFLAFRPDTLSCPTGALVHLKFHHAGRLISARHDWVLVYSDKLDSVTKDALDSDGKLPRGDARVIAATVWCDRGETVTTQFVAPAPGDYPFLCSTHPEDMRGILHVTK